MVTRIWIFGALLGVLSLQPHGATATAAVVSSSDAAQAIVINDLMAQEGSVSGTIVSKSSATVRGVEWLLQPAAAFAAGSTQTAAQTAMVDWSGSMVAAWQWEGGGTNAGGTCGAACNLTNNGPMAFDTTNFTQAAQSVAPNGSFCVGGTKNAQSCALIGDCPNGGTCTTSQYGSCSYTGGANCSALNFGANASWTFGSAVRFTTPLGRNEGFVDSEPNATTGGYFLSIQPTSSTTGNNSCGWCGAWGCDRIDVSGPLGTTSGWAWVACRYVNGTTSVSDIINGQTGWTGSPAGGGEPYAPSNATFFAIAGSPSNTCDSDSVNFIQPCGMNADVDDSWVYAGAMSDAALCRICAANVDGKAAGPNACNGTSYRSCCDSPGVNCSDANCGSPTVTGACDTASGLCQGRRHTKCNDCPMPTTCDQAVPVPVNTPVHTPTPTRTPANTSTAAPTNTPSNTPAPTVVLNPLSGPILVGGTVTLSGEGFTAGSRILLFVATATGAQSFGPYQPTGWTPTSLVWAVNANIPLGNGFGTVVIVNTDQGFIQSSSQSQLLYGSASANIPTILSINGVGVQPVDPTIPLAFVQTVLTPGAAMTIGGTGFNAPLVSLFTASGNVGPLTPLSGGTASSFRVTVPGNTPTGPGGIQVVNNPYAGNVLSNAVSAPIGALVTITSVTQLGSTVTVNGMGFSTVSVINLFNAQPGGVVNLGGLNASGGPKIPLTFVSSTQFTFTVPAGAVSGPSYIQVINPPFIPYSSSGSDPDGAITIAAL